MPKIKSHRGAGKRFKKTASGKFLRSHSFLRHQLTHKRRKRKRALRRRAQVSKSDLGRLRRLLPY